MSAIETKYLRWIKSIIKMHNYNKLLNYLYRRDFEYFIPMDENRYADGLNLRYQFGRECGIDTTDVHNAIDYMKPCSLLEMMVSLAIRMEDQIMSDADIGDRTSTWFKVMIQNLGLTKMRDDSYDEGYVQNVCDRLINREYEPDGTGGLFVIHSRREDMRRVEFWYQAMWYLSELDERRSKWM